MRCMTICSGIFLSTLSVRRATDTHQAEYPELSISIHALREESDLIFIGQLSQTSEFLSTLSVRRATMSNTAYQRGVKISIHALREESDVSFFEAFDSCK